MNDKNNMFLEILLRITAVENVLIHKGFCTEQELLEEIRKVRDSVIKTIEDYYGYIPSPGTKSDRTKN